MIQPVTNLTAAAISVWVRQFSDCSYCNGRGRGLTLGYLWGFP